MAKATLNNFEILSLEQEISDFLKETLSFQLRFQLSKIQEEVGRVVKLIREEQEKLQEVEKYIEIEVDERNVEKEVEKERLTQESSKLIAGLFSEEVDLTYYPIKISLLEGMVTDKPYFLLFKFFV